MRHSGLKYLLSLTEQFYLDGGAPVVPLGDDAGGQGVPLAVDPDVAPEFVCDAPEVLLPEFVEPEFGEPEFVVVGSDPGLGVVGLESGFDVAGFVEPAVPGALPGSVPHGDPLGVVPVVFVVFGFTVEGDVLVPGVAGAGEFEPGMLPGEVAFGDDPFGLLCGVVCGAEGCADGVAVWAGGVAVPGELWAIVQLAQHQSMNNNVIIFADINLASKTDSLVLPSGFFGSSGNVARSCCPRFSLKYP
jgi:hypothetical protein